MEAEKRGEATERVEDDCDDNRKIYILAICNLHLDSRVTQLK